MLFFVDLFFVLYMYRRVSLMEAVIGGERLVLFLLVFFVRYIDGSRLWRR